MPTLFDSYLMLLESMEIPERVLKKGSKRSPEKDLIAAICREFDLPPACDLRRPMAEFLAMHVPLEAFVAFLGYQVEPFARMISEVYDFLSRHGRTASSAQTITEIRIGKHVHFPVDLSGLPTVVERFLAEGFQDVWNVDILGQLFPRLRTLNAVAPCPGNLPERGQTCPFSLRSACRLSVQELQSDFRSILEADRVRRTRGGSEGVPEDLRVPMETFTAGAADPSLVQAYMADCLGEQHYGHDDDPFTQQELREARAIVNRARERVRAQMEMLQEFFQLPYWRHRNDLFEVWTLVRLCNALPEAQVALRNVTGGAWTIPGNKQGGPGKSVMNLGTLRGEFSVYTGRIVPVGKGRNAMPDWLFCRSQDDAPEFLIECKCGESYRYDTTMKDPMIGRYLPLLHGTRGSALLVNYRDFSGSRKVNAPGVAVIERLAPRLAGEISYRNLVRQFFHTFGPNSLPSSAALDLAVAFDATLSMAAVLPGIRDGLTQILRELACSGLNVRVAAVAIGDHDGNAYVTHLHPFTNEIQAVIDFINGVEPSSGWSFEEAYEDALRDLSVLTWRTGAQKYALMVGDDIPHEADQCPEGLDWRQCASDLAAQGVRMDTVSFAPSGPKALFYTELATVTSGQMTTAVDAEVVTNVLRKGIAESSSRPRT